MNKYFAYDALEREFTTHDTLDEAKSQAQDCVDQIFEFGTNDGFDTDLEDAIKEGCFGVVLGGFDLPTRPLTEEEKELYADEFIHMVENPPVLVEYPQNGWIKCSERLPGDWSEVLFAMKVPESESGWLIRTGSYFEDGMGFCSFDGVEFEGVTHWKPLPQPPID
ncbi:DUF551 domain-containing protein [Aggregatibacter aphrophilus]|uniref:Protein of uncharacterized function (DUF551) n=2 Tax=Aggregatibacter aphrophilus TaxID=732 RepID=A0A3S4PWT6_AGGAP|nr:DUF551 domain-containing protein [Aggregatibacter aphrophilus]KNE84417.1 restriction endonuclease Bsp6I [Aggregatibacter aphrophilus ATCC 33389]OBY54741.1 restriction endonuclease [Aggregatibacter aphrophilus]RDE96515.1 DUF551 domain-containing protein [Aggregatibacter aphrophilus]SSY93998.1 Protein of uncharacterised function (DUF551) [Aggregatibacter aphrophilus]VEF40576.1 Protein of uncharacterised function (DUF551) [Aggregatibacter aphrophilus ATCC 33389]